MSPSATKLQVSVCIVPFNKAEVAIPIDGINGNSLREILSQVPVPERERERESVTFSHYFPQNS